MFRRPSSPCDVSSLAQSGISAEGSSVSVSCGQGASPLDDVFASRPLTPAEADSLRAALRATLKLTNCPCALQAEEDAVDLLTYVLDLINDGETVGGIVEELEVMELEICTPSSLEEIRVVLSSFLGKMDGRDQENAIKTFVQRNSLQSRLRRGENHVPIDLSCKTARAKKEEEMQCLFDGARPSIRDRMSMYDDQGRLRGSFKDPKGAVDGDHLDCDTTDQASIDRQRRQELMMVMNDKSLTKTERSKKMGEVRAKYGLLETKVKVAHAKTSSNRHSNNAAPSKRNCVSRAEKELRPGHCRSSIDLSANVAAAKNQHELEAICGNVSLKDRMSMYDSNGKLIVKKEEEKVEEAKDAPKEKSMDRLRREELMSVMRDRSLSREEKVRKMEQVKQKYGAIAENGDKPSADQHPGQSSQETPRIHGRRLSQEDLDERERTDLQIILRDRTLSTLERKRKMAQVRGEYTALSREVRDDGSAGSGSAGPGSSGASSAANANLDLSASGSAYRKRESLERLRSGKLMSLRERKSMYGNNEFIKALA